MLGIHLVRDGEADAPELVARRLEHFAAPVEQAAEGAARDCARDVHGARGGSQCELHAFGIERIGDRRDFRSSGAEHQRLAVADEYVDRAGAFGDRGHAHLGGDLVDQAVALVEQVVRRLAGILGGNGDFAVETGDALRQQGHLARFAGEARIDVGGHLAQPPVVILQPLRERAALRQQHLAGGNGSGRARYFAQGVGIGLQRSSETVGRVAQHVVEPLGLRRECVEAREIPAAAAALGGQELIIDAPHLARVHAVADPARADHGGLARREFGTLPAVTGRRDVRDVVGRGVQRTL
jgi:hypothetical protein